jgi:hypothetical protein
LIHIKMIVVDDAVAADAPWQAAETFPQQMNQGRPKPANMDIGK